MNARKKHGQITGMPLIFIIVVIFSALVLFFGYRSVQDVWGTKDITQISAFILNLEDDVEVIYNLDVGSGKEFIAQGLPNKLTDICFVDPTRELTLSEEQLDFIDERLAIRLDINTLYNVILIPIGAYPPPAPDFIIPHLTNDPVGHNPYCVPIMRGSLRLALESQYVSVQGVPSTQVVAKKLG